MPKCSIGDQQMFLSPLLVHCGGVYSKGGIWNLLHCFGAGA
jgi:hypothetical protein